MEVNVRLVSLTFPNKLHSQHRLLPQCFIPLLSMFSADKNEKTAVNCNRLILLILILQVHLSYASIHLASVLTVTKAELHMLREQRDRRRQTLSSTCHLLFLAWCKLITLLRGEEWIKPPSGNSPLTTTQTQHFTDYTKSSAHSVPQGIKTLGRSCLSLCLILRGCQG